MIRAGRVRLNGHVVDEPGVRALPGRDRVELDGRAVPLAPGNPRWIAFHKPPDALTTRSDPHGGRTVYDLLPEPFRGLRYVGRLDRDTEGLLLFTDDGDAIHALTHPSSAVEREYHAGVRGAPTADVLSRLTLGVELGDGPARALRARALAPERAGGVLALVLAEGRKREVRRLLEAVGHPVRWLRRVRFGPVRLGELALGQWRALDPDEIAGIERAAGPPPPRSARPR